MQPKIDTVAETIKKFKKLPKPHQMLVKGYIMGLLEMKKDTTKTA